MRALLLLALLVVAGGGIAYLLLDGGAGGSGGDAAKRMEDDVFVPPALRGSGVEGRRPARAGSGRSRAPTRERVEDDPTSSRATLSLRVVDAETGEGLAAARIGVVEHQEPCPGPRTLEGSALIVTGEDGRAEVPAAPSRGAGAAVPFDLVVSARGYVPAVLCLPEAQAEIEVRLEKGLAIRGRVRSPAGKPLRGALVRARPGPETPALPGHFSVESVAVDEEGRFTLDGFRPGAVVLDAWHPEAMPRTTEPVDVPLAEDLEIVLEPAVQLTLRIATGDGLAPSHPTLTWIRKEEPTKPNVLLLEPRTEDAGVPLECRPVKVPATSDALFLEVQADGYAPWRRTDWKPPTNVREQTLEVELSSDLSTGSLRASLVDEQGEAVHYAQARVRPAIEQLSGDSANAAYVLEQAEDLRITAMPAGTYRLRLESPRFAPVETDATISPGQETVVTIPVAPPAKMHVRVYGPEGLLVRFRVLRDGKVANGFPEGAVSRGTDETTGEPILTAGQDGLTLTGLAGGTCTVEVVSEEVEGASQVVHLREGETTEVELTVTQR